MDPNKQFKDLSWADLTIVGDRLTLIRKHYVIQHMYEKVKTNNSSTDQ